LTLAKAILSLKTEKEVNNFLRDLCTPGEIKDFNERWAIAQLLNIGEFSYREIAEKAKASITTVTRVARFLKDEPYKGYITALSRIKSHHRH
jgi:TrpR-related protein YerC/YecD